jgi:hypothetical protein
MSNTIPNIHNYCDRWCERCSFTKNCALNIELISLTDGKEIDETLLDDVSSNFKATVDLLTATARKDGIEVEEINEVEAALIEKNMRKKAFQIMKHPLTRLCRSYIMEAHKLLTDIVYWKNKAKQLVEKIRTGLVDEPAARIIAEEMNECQEVIGWYIFQIEIKFARALSGKTEGEELSLQSDANGSAKVALNAVERSMNAIKHLHKLTNEEDRYLPLLACLSKIDAAGRREFPNAPLFIRPGFDEQ